MGKQDIRNQKLFEEAKQEILRHYTRRHFLKESAMGLGALALGSIIGGVTLAPFVTGYLAYHQYFDYDTVLILHIFFGELMLVVIPFTKLSHFLMFFFSRGITGMEFGRRSAPSW